ncbi:MAG: UDP-N-acetylglucosamine pyrophosphorylase [Lachnospiraceae bacterium]|nr:UDP-N-acetylglucosamine pyrophosphorylase [Lachnospiraceae bacterium]
MIKDYTIENMFDLEETIAAEYLSTFTYPWEALGGIKEFILKKGPTLPEEIFEKKGEDIWIARSAKIHPSANISGPCIIDEEAELRPGAFIRGSVIIGKKATVGNSCECKNSILFNRAEVPHFNYVGDSIFGFRAHTGAGAITSNIKSDRKNIVLKDGDEVVETGLRKMGAMLGDLVEVGCNTVLNPGSVVGRGARIYPLSPVRGFVPAGHIFKAPGQVVKISDTDGAI